MIDCTYHQGIPMGGPAALPRIISTERMQNVPYLIREQSLNSVRIFWLERDKTIEVLRERAERCLKASSDITEIILFGSLAEGKAVPGSDADILILLKRSEKPFLKRMECFQGFFSGLGIGVEVFPYTLQEARDNPLACQARESGLTLAKRP